MKLLEPLAAYWSRKRWERLQYEQAARLLEQHTREHQGSWNTSSRSRRGNTIEDEDEQAWKLVHSSVGRHGPFTSSREVREVADLREQARHLVDTNPFARNALMLYRNYVVGTGMRYEVYSRAPLVSEGSAAGNEPLAEQPSQQEAVTPGLSPAWLQQATELWHQFLEVNHWETGPRRDWEFCIRTWRDGECFLRLFRQPHWPPRVHFVDPERIIPDPATGLPTAGIATEPENIEEPLWYRIQQEDHTAELVPAERILHCKIHVDANGKRGISLFAPVLDALEKYQSWLDIELIHRKVASSIVLVRKHAGTSTTPLSTFADWAAQPAPGAGSPLSSQQRRALLQPGTMIDAQGYDLQYLSPDAHFDDATILGRRLLLAVAAGTGLPEFMLTADAANANYSSTLVSEGPAVRLFTSWQAFFIGQWQALFQRVMQEAVRLKLLPAAALRLVRLRITPPPVAVRNRREDAEADALYYDRGAISRRELARRDHTDPAVMEAEIALENQARPAASAVEGVPPG